MRLRTTWLVLVLTLGLAPAAEADGGKAQGQPDPAHRRVAEIPASTVEITREIVTPAVTRRICTPVYTEVAVPIEEHRRTPRYEEIDAPVYAWRQVPIYRTRQAPLYGTKLEPVYEDVTRRVSLPLCAPGGCACVAIPLYEKCAKRQVAWLETEEVTGYRTDSLARGMRRERYVARTEKKRVLVGYDEETVQVGMRVGRRLKGYACEVIELAPARTEIVKEIVTIPARKVTVVADGAPAAPLSGTSAVLTVTELEAALSAR